MKKFFFFSLFGMLFLSGCNKIKNTRLPLPEPTLQQQTSWESILTPDTGTYPNPQIIIGEATGMVLTEINGKVQNEISHTSTQEEKDNGRKESIVSGYQYTYSYEDLGMKISTSPLYEPYFYEIPKIPIFQRHGNMIFFSEISDDRMEYIQKLTKDADISFYDQIKNKHTPTGCKIDLFTGYEYTFLTKPNTMISAMFDDESPTENTCVQKDTEFPRNTLLTVFLYNPKNPTTYYKISLGDACAPGPCTIFGNIEFF